MKLSLAIVAVWVLAMTTIATPISMEEDEAVSSSFEGTSGKYIHRGDTGLKSMAHEPPKNAAAPPGVDGPFYNYYRREENSGMQEKESSPLEQRDSKREETPSDFESTWSVYYCRRDASEEGTLNQPKRVRPICYKQSE